ncbi:hypothetical protein [Zhihengliuella sp.]|uniref:hypothetical protein n=1 Tax=Zhihengliuella sp. TaxID=1954483 RepID=UPI002811E118|nr:hypothetical protein [Zhihengliuella sp.]
MRNTGFRLAMVVAGLYAAFAGFMFTSMADESTIPGAARVEVSGESATTGGVGLTQLIQNLSDDSEATIVKRRRDLHDARTRHFYVVLDDAARAEARWLTDRYPSFTSGIETLVHPAADLEGLDPRGTYYVLGGRESIAAVESTFQSLGYTTTSDNGDASIGQAIAWFVGGPAGSATLVAVLLIALLAGVSVISSVKSYAIQRLHGFRKRTAICRDLRRLAPFSLLAVICVGTISWGCLWWYNGLNQFGMFIRVSGAIFVAAALLAIVVHVATVVIVWDTRLLEGIKGRLGFRVAVPGAYFIRLPGLFLAVSLVTGAFAAAGAALEAGQARADLAAAGNAATMTFEASVPPEEMDRLAYESGAWLKEEDLAGRTIAAIPLSLDGEGAQAEGDVLLVNNKYLELNPVLDVDGVPVAGAGSEAAKVLVPAGSSTSVENIENALPESLGRGDTRLSLEIQTIRPGQSHFLYEPRPDARQRPVSLSDVAVVVAGPESGLIRDDDYMAYASQGRVLVTDAAEAVRNTPPELMGQWISAYIPVAQSAADEYAAKVATLRVEAATAIVALGVLLATAIGLAQMHVRGNAQTILVRHLHGWTFIRTHRWLLAAELALLGIVTCWALVRASTLAIREHSAADVLRGADLAVAVWQPWAVLIVAILNVGLLTACVFFRTRSMVRTHSEETA